MDLRYSLPDNHEQLQNHDLLRQSERVQAVDQAPLKTFVARYRLRIRGIEVLVLVLLIVNHRARRVVIVFLPIPHGAEVAAHTLATLKATTAVVVRAQVLSRVTT
jgi:hypothetical protein